MDRITTMRAVVEAADRESFTAAGRTLGITGTMVGKHVAATEARLGTKLFYRSTRRVWPTVAGRRYVEECRLLLAQIDRLDASVLEQKNHPMGTLTISVPLAFADGVLQPVIDIYAERYPAVVIDVDGSHLTVQELPPGRDLAISFLRLGGKHIASEYICSVPLVVCGSPVYVPAPGRLNGPHDKGFRFARIVEIDLDRPRLCIDINAVYRTRPAPPPTVMAFLKLAREVMSVRQLPST